MSKTKEILTRINYKKIKGFFQKPLFDFKYISLILLALFSWQSSSSLRFLTQEENFSSLLMLSTYSYPESSQMIFIQQNSIKGLSSPLTVPTRVLAAFIQGDTDIIERGGVIEYTVVQGDSLSRIASRFNISLDTLLWANNLRTSTIRPGQRLIILPVSGVKHTVEEGDTISAIAKEYDVEAEEILSFNNILKQEDILAGETIVVPGGVKPRIILPIREIVQNIENLTSGQIRARFSTNHFHRQSHSFPFGQCTWWVAQKRAIGRWGHAKNWLANAQRDGFLTCRGRNCLPKAGAVIIVRGSPIFGHVGYVEKVRGNQVTFSEMNNIGWGRVNYRTVTVGSHQIIGYIY